MRTRSIHKPSSADPAIPWDVSTADIRFAPYGTERDEVGGMSERGGRTDGHVCMPDGGVA